MARKTDAERASIAFEAYYNLGSSRSLRKLAKVTGLEFELLCDWSEGYGWDELIDNRERDIQKTYDRVYKKKTVDIRNRLTSQIEKLLAAMETSSLGLPFEIKSPNDVRAIAQAYECLVRANIAAITKGASAVNNKSPTTWSDLLNQADVDSLPDVD